jgi:hypothetical protein
MAENSVRISVRVDDDTASGLARVRASIDTAGRAMSARLREHGRTGGDSLMSGVSGSIARGAPAAGTQLGGALASSAGESFSGGFGGIIRTLGENPVVAAGIGIAGLVIGGALATLIGGALILGLGGAFTAIGVMAVANTAPVKKAWGTAAKDIKEKIKDAASPLIPVLVTAAGIAQQVVDTFAPAFKSAFTKVAPQMSTFLKSLGDAVDKFKPAIQPVMTAFGAILDALDPVVGQVAGDLSDAFVNLANTMAKKQNAKAFADLVKLILELTTVDVVNGIAAEADAFGKLDAAIHDLNDATGGKGLSILSDFLHFVAKATFVMPLDNTATGIEGIAKAINLTKTARSSFSTWMGKLASKAVTLTIKGVPAAIRLVQSVIGWIKKFLGKSVTLSVKGVPAAIKAVQSLINKVKGFVGKTVTVSVKAVVSGVTSTVKKLLGLAHGGIVGAGGFAHGGYVGHAAGGGPRSNRTLVGENGPEIVDLAPGSHVRSNPDTRRLLSQGGGGDNRVTLEIDSKGSDLDRVLVTVLKGAIRRYYGGNVNAALGS